MSTGDAAEQPCENALLDVLEQMVSVDDVEESRRRIDDLPGASASALVALARAHGVEAWLAGAVPGHWPQAVRRELAEQRAAFIAAQTRQRYAVRTLTSLWAQQGIRWALLKGLALAEHLYPRPDLRFAVDVDVLVAPADFSAAVSTAEAAGFALLDRNWPLLRRLEVGQLRLRSCADVLVDVHWHVLNAKSLRQHFRLSTNELLARAEGHADAGPLRLTAADELILVALHAAVSGGNRLIWLCDVDRQVRHRAPAWPQVVRTARSARAGAAVALMLLRAHHLLGTPVPEQALVELAGRAWVILVRDVAAAQLPADPTGAGLSRALSRAARDSAARSILTLAGHGIQHATTRRGTTGGQPWLSPDSPSSALHDVDSPGERRRYFAAVSGQS